MHVVALDALNWTRRVLADQYSERYVRRELLKVHAARLGGGRQHPGEDAGCGGRGLRGDMH